MKKTILIVPLIVLCSFTNIFQPSEASSKDVLIKKLLRHEQISKAKIHDEKLVVGMYGYCATNDCISYFKAYSKDIRVMKKEEIFKRPGLVYFIVEEINESKETMKGRLIKGDITIPISIQ